MPADARHMVVGRLRKPHGLKGDLTLFPITDAPETVFAPPVLLNAPPDEAPVPFSVSGSAMLRPEPLTCSVPPLTIVPAAVSPRAVFEVAMSVPTLTWVAPL